jgi:imidazolonepropionase-like amidohydrolase
MDGLGGPRGWALRGDLWRGGEAEVEPSAVVILDRDARVVAAGPVGSVEMPGDLPALGGVGCWIGPGLVDAHVHLAFGSPREMLAGGVVAVRDLGAPLDQALRWRADGRPSAGPTGPVVAVAGPIVTAPRGYPTNSWGAGGFAVEVESPAQAKAAVGRLADHGVDLVKIALEPADGQPVPSLDTARLIVDAAHDIGLAVAAHALTTRMVERALDAGVDELTHIPVAPLPAALVERVAAGGVPVVSTIHALRSYPASAVEENARALVTAGVPVIYGTDLGNDRTRTGAEPSELDLLARTGLGPRGAVLAATARAAGVPGLADVPGLGKIEIGEPAYCVVLRRDPFASPQAWRQPVAVAAGGSVVAMENPGDSAGHRLPGLGPPARYGADRTWPDAGWQQAPAGPIDRTTPLHGGSVDRRSIGPTPKTRLAWPQQDVLAALMVVLASLAVGALLGVVWERLAPKPHWVVQRGGAFLSEVEQTDFIAADGWFAVLGVAAGLLSGATAYFVFRRRVGAAYALPVASAVGGLLGSLLAWWVGATLGPGPIDSHRGAPDGSTFDGPLELSAKGVLLVWPITAVLVVLVLTAIFDRDEAGVSDAKSGRRLPQSSG